MIRLKRLLDLFMTVIESGEKQYVASMETMSGDKFTISIKAYSTADALMKIDEYTVDGCRMADLRLIDEYGNVY
jgi:hypothetical protein